MKNHSKMNADKIILLDSTLSIGLYVIVQLASLKGDYLGRAYLSLYSMTVFFFIAVAITIVNLFILKNTTTPWIRFLAFAPIALSIGHVCFVALELGSPGRSPKEQKEIGSLTVEIRASKMLLDPLVFMEYSSGNGQSYLDHPERKENGQYIYEMSFSLFNERDRTLVLHSPELTDESLKFYFNIDNKPAPAPFTDWEKFHDVEKQEYGSDNDTIKLEIRYMITKGRRSRDN